MTPMRRSQNWLPYVFNDLFDNDWMIKANSTAPAINVIESDKDYRVEVAAPGMTKNDFNIKIDENNNLVVSMEKKEEKNEDKKDGRYLRREFSYSKFQQTMVLPDNVEKDKIEAKVENGVLSISIPKRTEEEAKMAEKVIEIKGMMCGHCEAHVKKALEALEGVASAEASHEKGTAVVQLSGSVDDAALKMAVEEEGYEVTGIR